MEGIKMANTDNYCDEFVAKIKDSEQQQGRRLTADQVRAELRAKYGYKSKFLATEEELAEYGALMERNRNTDV
jgi:uncharacterized NAD-dependent epimerase/dehydratase family protein